MSQKLYQIIPFLALNTLILYFATSQNSIASVILYSVSIAVLSLVAYRQVLIFSEKDYQLGTDKFKQKISKILLNEDRVIELYSLTYKTINQSFEKFIQILSFNDIKKTLLAFLYGYVAVYIVQLSFECWCISALSLNLLLGYLIASQQQIDIIKEIKDRYSQLFLHQVEKGQKVLAAGKKKRH